MPKNNLLIALLANALDLPLDSEQISQIQKNIRRIIRSTLVEQLQQASSYSNNALLLEQIQKQFTLFKNILKYYYNYRSELPIIEQTIRDFTQIYSVEYNDTTQKTFNAMLDDICEKCINFSKEQPSKTARVLFYGIYENKDTYWKSVNALYCSPEACENYQFYVGEKYRTEKGIYRDLQYIFTSNEGYIDAKAAAQKESLPPRHFSVTITTEASEMISIQNWVNTHKLIQEKINAEGFTPVLMPNNINGKLAAARCILRSPSTIASIQTPVSFFQLPTVDFKPIDADMPRSGRDTPANFS